MIWPATDTLYDAWQHQFHFIRSLFWSYLQ